MFWRWLGTIGSNRKNSARFSSVSAQHCGVAFVKTIQQRVDALVPANFVVIHEHPRFVRSDAGMRGNRIGGPAFAPSG